MTTTKKKPKGGIPPTPTGKSPLPNLTSPEQTTRAQAVANYVQFLSARFGANVGQSYQNYADTHPHETAYQALANWANLMAASLGPSLAKAIQQIGKPFQQILGTGPGGKTYTANVAFDNLLITWLFEVIGLGLVTLIAESSDESGTIMVIVMVGLWLLFLIMRPDITRGINNIISYTAHSTTGGA